MIGRGTIGVDTVLGRFVAQDERPDPAGAVDVTGLSAYHRCLLVTDGTVTHLVQAHALEPTRTRCLEQSWRKLLPGERRWLCAEPGTLVLTRRVLIEGVGSGTRYVAAASMLVPDRLPASFVRSMNDEQASIGTALSRAAVEHRRELLWCESRPGAVASRTYRVFVRGVPALLISEDFLC